MAQLLNVTFQRPGNVLTRWVIVSVSRGPLGAVSWLHLTVTVLCRKQAGFQVVVVVLFFTLYCVESRLRLKCDGTRAETRFRLSAKRTNPFKSAVVSVQSTTGSRGVRISVSNGSNAGYTMFRGSVKSTGYPLHLPVSPSLPLPVRHRVPSHFNWTFNITCHIQTLNISLYSFVSAGTFKVIVLHTFRISGIHTTT